MKNQVSKITMRASESRMYDLLTCTQKAALPYSQISIEGELCYEKYFFVKYLEICIWLKLNKLKRFGGTINYQHIKEA